MSEAEDIRYAVRNYLAARPAVSQSADTIYRGVRRETECSAEQVKDALTFLTSAEQVQMTFSGLGSTRYYQITAKGTLAYERGE